LSAGRAQARIRAKSNPLGDRCERVAQQIRERLAGEPIRERLVSLSDPDARPIRKGKFGKLNQFGYVTLRGSRR
jgi:IS5 family transposase